MVPAALLRLSAALLWITGLTHGNEVTQTALLWVDQGQSATIECNHTKGSTYREMYWYRQLPGEHMKQIVYTTSYSAHQYESGFSKEKFPAEKKDAETGSLTVEKLLPQDGGVYFCAVSEHSDAHDSSSCTNTHCGCHSEWEAAVCCISCDGNIYTHPQKMRRKSLNYFHSKGLFQFKRKY
ncbi:uncharacterized protein V6R79_025918 [Siganus canaliculatus]